MLGYKFPLLLVYKYIASNDSLPSKITKWLIPLDVAIPLCEYEKAKFRSQYATCLIAPFFRVSPLQSSLRQFSLCRALKVNPLLVATVIQHPSRYALRYSSITDVAGNTPAAPAAPAPAAAAAPQPFAECNRHSLRRLGTIFSLIV